MGIWGVNGCMSSASVVRSKSVRHARKRPVALARRVAGGDPGGDASGPRRRDERHRSCGTAQPEKDALLAERGLEVYFSDDHAAEAGGAREGEGR